MNKYKNKFIYRDMVQLKWSFVKQKVKPKYVENVGVIFG